MSRSHINDGVSHLNDGVSYINAVFEGGGVKGVANMGVVYQLERLGALEELERVGGSSAGAITALLIGLGYSASELSDELQRVDMSKWKDRGGIVLFNKHGKYKGDKFYKWVQKMVEQKTGKPDTSFTELEEMYHQANLGNRQYFEGFLSGRRGVRDVYGGIEKIMENARKFKEMYFVATDLSTREAVVLSHKNEDYRHVPIADAVRASMAIPLFFEAKNIRNIDNIKVSFVDGGVIANYAFALFNDEGYVGKGRFTDTRSAGAQRNPDNPQTIGFRLDDGPEISHLRDGQPVEVPTGSRTAPFGFFSYMTRLIKVLVGSQQEHSFKKSDPIRLEQTAFVNTLNVKTTDFGLSRMQKKLLRFSGELSVLEFELLSKRNDSLYEYYMMHRRRSDGACDFNGGNYLQHFSKEAQAAYRMASSNTAHMSAKDQECCRKAVELYEEFCLRIRQELSIQGGFENSEFARRARERQSARMPDGRFTDARATRHHGTQGQVLVPLPGEYVPGLQYSQVGPAGGVPGATYEQRYDTRFVSSQPEGRVLSPQSFAWRHDSRADVSAVYRGEEHQSQGFVSSRGGYLHYGASGPAGGARWQHGVQQGFVSLQQSYGTWAHSGGRAMRESFRPHSAVQASGVHAQGAGYDIGWGECFQV